MEFDNTVSENLRTAIDARNIGRQTPQIESLMVDLINRTAEPLDATLDSLIERLEKKKVVCLGESTHGTEEYYQLRADITERLVREKGFRVVAFESDFPDMDELNSYIQGDRSSWDSFHRFPTWMWRNSAFSKFADRLRDYNLNDANKDDKVSFYGLDLYSLHSSLEAVHKYMRTHLPEKTDFALQAKLCLQPWEHDPTLYGLSVWNEEIKGCQEQILKLLSELQKSSNLSLSARMNAFALKSAENYYRAMFEGNAQSWNVRDRHMFETIQHLLKFHGPDSKIIVWEHNSHIGNCAATQMSLTGEFNVGQLCKNTYNDDCYLVGFLTHTGTVAAADSWGSGVKIKSLRESRPDSYENLFHRAQSNSFCLPLNKNDELNRLLKIPRLQRAVGVIYLPATERQSHYFAASLPEQFDEVIWIDETSAVHPLEGWRSDASPETFPFGL